MKAGGAGRSFASPGAVEIINLNILRVHVGRGQTVVEERSSALIRRVKLMRRKARSVDELRSEFHRNVDSQRRMVDGFERQAVWRFAVFKGIFFGVPLYR